MNRRCVHEAGPEVSDKPNLTHYYGFAGEEAEAGGQCFQPKIINVHRYSQAPIKQFKDESYEEYRKNVSIIDNFQYYTRPADSRNKDGMYYTPNQLSFVRKSSVSATMRPAIESKREPRHVLNRSIDICPQPEPAEKSFESPEVAYRSVSSASCSKSGTHKAKMQEYRQSQQQADKRLSEEIRVVVEPAPQPNPALKAKADETPASSVVLLKHESTEQGTESPHLAGESEIEVKEWEEKKHVSQRPKPVSASIKQKASQAQTQKERPSLQRTELAKEKQRLAKQLTKFNDYVPAVARAEGSAAIHDSQKKPRPAAGKRRDRGKAAEKQHERAGMDSAIAKYEQQLAQIAAQRKVSLLDLISSCRRTRGNWRRRLRHR